MRGRLLFVYNAKSKLTNKVFDYVHKLVSPQTYTCNLCLLTHTNVGERKEWTNFVKTLDLDLQFLYSNVFERIFPAEKKEYPVVYIETAGEIKELVSKHEINSANNLQELIKLIKQKTEHLHI